MHDFIGKTALFSKNEPTRVGSTAAADTPALEKS